MTKKNFEDAAFRVQQVESALGKHEAEVVCAAFVGFFADDNPRFDAGRFERACKVGANVKAREAGEAAEGVGQMYSHRGVGYELEKVKRGGQSRWKYVVHLDSGRISSDVFVSKTEAKRGAIARINEDEDKDVKERKARKKSRKK